MALEQSALLELVESLSTADEGTLMRRLLATILQQLIDAEASGGRRRLNLPAIRAIRSSKPALQLATSSVLIS